MSGQIALHPTGGAAYDSSIVTADIVFTAETSKDAEIEIKRQTREVLRGRLYINADPGIGFDQTNQRNWATLTFYSKAVKHGADAAWRSATKIIYDEIKTATTGLDKNIIPDDHKKFSPNDLVWILDWDSADEIIRLATIASTMIAEDDIEEHDINDGLAKVVEFSGFSLFNNESETKVYLRISFPVAQSVSLHMELVLRK